MDGNTRGSRVCATCYRPVTVHREEIQLQWVRSVVKLGFYLKDI